ncbi:hypothetical protein JBKA6_1001 [Ichthyobacterium seriolicida]|uniref:Uncharacterized protein n=1 Tax=Ichthyobacterium seriolicida TaxID=242600 RepID=A0A1J1E6P8_9FLAO|nr:hypothetical protein JBKA6_1001 [Ichthyobacterium seriolicida]
MTKKYVIVYLHTLQDSVKIKKPPPLIKERAFFPEVYIIMI